MKNDMYLRAVLTVIAAALVYLCVILTPMPIASAQAGRVIGAPTPGVSTGPAEMVIVGWRVPDTIPVAVTRGEVRVSNETLRVTGRVEAEQPENTVHRTTLIGWEESGRPDVGGAFRAFDARQQALPVVVRQP